MAPADALRADLRASARGLRRSPGFTVAAVLTLALGIGATSTIFSVARAVLFSRCRTPTPARRVMIWSQWKGWDRTWVSEAELFDYRTRCRTLASVAAWDSAQVNLTGAGEPVRVTVGRVTGNTFQTLGAAPFLGRSFTAEEDKPGQNGVALISHGLWQRHYAADPGDFGTHHQLDGRAARRGRRDAGRLPAADGLRRRCRAADGFCGSPSPSTPARSNAARTASMPRPHWLPAPLSNPPLPNCGR